jgi:hypothetical protein
MIFERMFASEHVVGRGRLISLAFLSVVAGTAAGMLAAVVRLDLVRADGFQPMRILFSATYEICNAPSASRV